MTRVLPLLVLIACTQILQPSTVHAQTTMQANGWHTWSVTAVSDTPQRCCYQWQNNHPKVVACDLDAKHFSYGSADEFASASGHIRVFAQRLNGTFTRARALGPNCPVKSSTAIIDLGPIDNDDSVAWLSPLIGGNQKYAGDALAAIAVHAGDAASLLLERTARSNPDVETRKNAVFWIGQARIQESGALLRELMQSGEDKELRKHAVFSYAQSAATDREAALIRIVEQRSVSYEERKNALFWLVQTDSTEAIDYIQRLLASND